jgi:transposase InsO family protein
VLVTDALRMPLARRDLPQPANLIQHTDHSSQYTADEYLALLKAHSIQVSMSSKGDSYDNAMMESFFSTLQAELLDLERVPTRQAARSAVFEFIEVFYNRQRLHSSLDYRSPVAFEIAHPGSVSYSSSTESGQDRHAFTSSLSSLLMSCLHLFPAHHLNKAFLFHTGLHAK